MLPASPPPAQECAAEAAFLASHAKPAVGEGSCLGREVSAANSFYVSGWKVSEQQLARPPKSGGAI